MQGASLDELDRLAKSLRETKKEVTACIRGIKRKAARANNKVSGRCRDEVLLQASAIAKVTMSPDDVTWFLRWHRRRAFWSSEAADWTQGGDEKDGIMAMSNSAEIEEMLKTPGHKVMTLAMRWIAEWRTFQWLFDLNTKGIAPTAADVRENFICNVPADGHTHLTDVLTNIQGNAKEQENWMRIFRKRWDLQHRTLAVGQVLTDPEIRKRVTQKLTQKIKLSQPGDPQKWGPHGPKVGASVIHDCRQKTTNHTA